jgi:hypothetical protein
MTVTTERPYHVEEKLDRVLKELADIRAILEGLMQPLVVLDRPDRRKEVR